MIIKQKRTILLLFALLITSIATSLLVSQDTYAYKCPGTLVYKDQDAGSAAGACYSYEQQDDSTAFNINPSDGSREGCKDSNATLHSDGHCWKLKRENVAPVKNDGTEIQGWSCNNRDDEDRYSKKYNACYEHDGVCALTDLDSDPGSFDDIPDYYGESWDGNPIECDVHPPLLPAKPDGTPYVDNTVDPQVAQAQKDKAKKQCTDRSAIWRDADSTCEETKKSCESPPRSGKWEQGAGSKFVCVGGTPQNTGGTPPPFSPNPTSANECGKFADKGAVQTSLISCEGDGASALGNVLKLILTILSVGIGIFAVGGIVYGATLYASAQDNATQTKKAVELITNVIIGLLLYVFMFAIVNWLVPGGVL